MSHDEEDHSTHQMVIGLHRRFDNVEENVKHLTEQSQLASERMIRMEGRIDLAEAKSDALAERETLIHENVKEALASTNSIVKKLFDKFDAHTLEEAEDRLRVIRASNKQVWWLVGTCVSVLTSIGMIMFSKVFGA